MVLGVLTVLDIDNLQISLARVSCQYPELTINAILERIWKRKCDLFRLKFDAIIVKFVAMQDCIQKRSFNLSGSSIVGIKTVHPTIQAP